MLSRSLSLSYTHIHYAHSHSTHTHTHTHTSGFLQRPLPAPDWPMRSRGSQIRRLLLPVSPTLNVTDSDSIQSKIIKMIIEKGKKQRKEKELDFLMLSAAAMVGLYALQQASRRARNLLISDDQQVADDAPCVLSCECFLSSPPHIHSLLCVLVLLLLLFANGSKGPVCACVFILVFWQNMFYFLADFFRLFVVCKSIPVHLVL